MKESDIVGQLVSELRSALSTNPDIHVDANDGSPEPPEVILDFSPFRLDNHQGHKSKAGTVRDNNGNAIGEEYHGHYRMELTATFRYFDPLVRDDAIHEFHEAFIRYESRPNEFDSDTTEWDVGSGARSVDTIVEHDWYEGNAVLTFQYVKKHSETTGYDDAIETINIDVDPDESIEENTTETK